MFIFGNLKGNDMEYRYYTSNDSDLLTAVDKLEVFLQSVDHRQKTGHVAMA